MRNSFKGGNIEYNDTKGNHETGNNGVRDEMARNMETYYCKHTHTTMSLNGVTL